MSITDKEILEIRKAIDESARPLIFFDDDPDGVCSFLQIYRYKGDGKGVIVKVTELNEDFLRKVEEYQPDLVMILDIPRVTQEFLDGISQKVIWIDHHEPVNPKGVKYYNPRIHDDKDNRPVSYWTHKIADQKRDLWIAMTGCVGDWFVPEFKDEVIEEYPHFFKKEVNTPPKAMFETKAGLLSTIISFNLKGTVSDSMKAVKILTRIQHPDEILKQKSSRGKVIWKKYDYYNKEYHSIMHDIKLTDDILLVHIYQDNKTSYTKEMSNELLYKYPEKIIVLGREKNGDVKLSLRSSKKPLAPALKKALEDVEGYGGGHLLACGANIAKKDFEKFLDNLRTELKD